MSTKIFVNPALLERLSNEELSYYKRALQRFLEGGNGARREKLESPTLLYSSRRNQEARLILSPVVQNGEQHWFWAEVLEHHQYDSLRHKPNSWLAKLMKDCVELPLDNLMDKETDEAPKDKLYDFLHETKSVEFFDQKFIVLDPHQEKAKYAKLPLIISGSPGAGKTCVAHSLISQYVQDNSGKEKKRILYVAKSKALVRFMEEEWQAHGDTTHEVSFQTPEQLFLNSQKINNPQNTEEPPVFVSQIEFNAYWIEYIKKQGQVDNVKSKSRAGSHKTPSEERLPFSAWGQQSDLAYQEFRIISGYPTFDAYNNAVGNKQSLFQKEPERKAMWQYYQDYMLFLKNQKPKHINFDFYTEFDVTPYDLVVVDESQDFSRKYLAWLASLSLHSQVAFCIGDHQQLFDSKCLVPFLTSMLHEKGIPVEDISHETLFASHRCPAKVVQFANDILHLKHIATGGTYGMSKHQLTHIQSSIPSDTPGTVDWLDSEAKLLPYIKDEDNAELVVIAPPEHKEEAQKLFGIGRVVTPEEYKGLQSKEVLLYRIFDTAEIRAVNSIIGKNVNLDASLPKNTDGNILHGTAFNKLFIAITRAENAVRVYQPEVTELRNIIKPLKLRYPNTADVPAPQPVHFSAERWERQASKLRENGLVDQATAIDERLAKKAATEVPSSSAKTATDKVLRTNEHEIQAKTVGRRATISAPAEASSSSKNTADEYEEMTSLIGKVIKEKSQKALKQLLQHEKAEQYLFGIKLKEINASYPDSTLYTWLKTKNAPLLTQTALNIFMELQKRDKKKKNATELKQFMHLISHVEDNNPYDSGYSIAASLIVALWEENDLASLNFIVSQTDPLRLKNCMSVILESYYDMEQQHFDAQNAQINMQHVAITPENLERLSLLGANLDLQMKRFKGASPIHLSVIHGREVLIKKLHELKADINKQSKSGGETPAYIAAEYGRLGMLLLLYRLGADLTKPTFSGAAPVHGAARIGELNVLKMLLRLNIPLNAVDNKGANPLFFAAENGHQECVQFLLLNGVDPNQSALYAKDELEIAVRKRGPLQEGRAFTYIYQQEGNIISLTPDKLAYIMGYDTIASIIANARTSTNNPQTSALGFFKPDNARSDSQPDTQSHGLKN